MCYIVYNIFHCIAVSSLVIFSCDRGYTNPNAIYMVWFVVYHIMRFDKFVQGNKGIRGTATKKFYV